jgi:hypothetical protein
MYNSVFSLEMAGIGMLIVFFIILLIALTIVQICKMLAKSKGEVCSVQQMDSGVSGGVPVLSSPSQAVNLAAPVLSMQGERPEVVAAAMGAILSALEGREGRQFAITSITSKDEQQSSWARAGRNRLMQTRQDFATRKRGIVTR